ncbi:toll-like receptor 4 [Coccinella septempunctata]|uniref:toll-like receptor 4 n=1 Tax=Coccinella septempunctata TaxID=41139 RepID=UPI001D072319|nr:toll-like receptor 4 [Coccinella septempunctata]
MQRYVLLLLFFRVVATINTCTSPFCPPVLEKRKITIERELPLKFIGRDEASGCNCAEAPNVYSLCYNINSKMAPCSKFPKDMTISTKTLILKTTHITELVYGDFFKMVHLEMLTIDNNQYLSRVQPYIFQNMTNLTSLSFISNPLLTTFHEDTFQGLVNLQELNLVKNGFQEIKVLASAMKPEVLPSLLRINLNENVFQNITENDFETMEASKLDELNLIACAIEYIHPKALKPLKHLSILRLGSNRFDVETLLDLLIATIDIGIDLKVLDLYLSGLRGSLPSSVLEVIAKSNISSLILKRNQFDILETKLFPVYMPNLTMLDLTDVSAQTIHDQAFSKLPNLKTLVLAKNRLSYFSASKHLSNLTYLDLQKNTDSYGWEFSLAKSEFYRMKLQYLDLQFTRLLVLTKTDFGQMPHLRILNLKNCSIFKIENDSFRGMPKLQFLNLDNNLFFKMWINPKIDFDMFGGLENLQVLMMAGNSISTLRTSTKHLLKHLKNLKHLGLNRNSLQTISREDFDHLTSLEVLDISENRILSWDGRVFQHIQLKKLYCSFNKITRLSDAMIQDFQYLKFVQMDFNSFICDCFMKGKTSSNISALIKFSQLIKDQQIYCLRPYNNETVLNFLQNIINSKLDCDSEVNLLGFILPLFVILVIFCIVAIVIYIYRWHVRYWLFLIRIYLIRKGKVQNSGVRAYTNYQYDAFVSYCNQDQNFVIKLVKMLENNETHLRLCIYERDFQVGSYISESVLENIAKSRKTVLVVSNSYAKSYWCNWESQIAEHHRLFSREMNDLTDDSIVLIKLGNIDDAHLNPTLKYIMKTRIYLEWDADEEKQVVFWRKLRQFLMAPKCDTENTRL